jgi:hypothetical protein
MHFGYCIFNCIIVVAFLLFGDWASSLGEIIVVVNFSEMLPVPE